MRIYQIKVYILLRLLLLLLHIAFNLVSQPKPFK